MAQENPRERIPYPIELKGYLSQMDIEVSDALAKAQYQPNTGYEVEDIVERTAEQLWRNGTMESLAEFETCLRDIGSRVYCIATPLGMYGGGYPTYNPAHQERDPKYTLAIATSSNERARMLQECEMDIRENTARLPETGLLLTSL